MLTMLLQFDLFMWRHNSKLSTH